MNGHARHESIRHVRHESKHGRHESVDLEAQKEENRLSPQVSPSAQSGSGAIEYEVSLHKKLVALAFYFFLSLGLTLQSKIVLQKFAFPYILTALHTGITAIGCYGLMLRGYIRLSTLGTRENMVLLAFSSLFTINIAISNVSLAMVSVAFHQILRSTVPVSPFSYIDSTLHAPIYGDLPLPHSLDPRRRSGYLWRLLLHQPRLHAHPPGGGARRRQDRGHQPPDDRRAEAAPLEFLLRMCPLAAVQSLLYSYFTGEGTQFMAYVAEGHLTRFQMFALLSNAIIAFLLNISSFQTNKIAGALTMTVCGNVKQVLTVLLGIVLFNVQVGLTNGLGMAIALAGAAYYSKVELNKKREQASTSSKADDPQVVRNHTTTQS